MQNISRNAFRCSDEQRTPIHQDSEWKPPKSEVLQCHCHYCSHQVNSYKRLDYLSPPDKRDLIWDNHIVSGSTCKNVASGWRAAASRWRDPFPLTPELHHLVSKFFPLREWLERGSPVQPLQLCKHSGTYWLAERALYRLGPQLLRLLCKSSWAYFRKTWCFW